MIKKEKIRKTLMVISILIIGLGIISAINVSNELTNNLGVSDNTAYLVDGSDFSPLAEAFTSLGAMIIGFVVIFYNTCIIVAIWVIYGIILLIIKIKNKIKERKNGKKCS